MKLKHILLCVLFHGMVAAGSAQIAVPVDPDLGVQWNAPVGTTCTPILLDTLSNGDLFGVGYARDSPGQSNAPMSFRADAQGLLRRDHGRYGAFTGVVNGDMYLAKAAVLPDGTHWVLAFPGGNSYRLYKFGPGGLPDAGFGVDGNLQFVFSPIRHQHLAALPDERIVLGGYRSPMLQAEWTRLLADGTVDTTFGSGGVVTMPSFQDCRDMHRLVDGRILSLVDSAGERSALLMFTPDGALDTTWMGDGQLDLAPGSFGLRDFKLVHWMPDGRFLLYGRKVPPSNDHTLVMVLQDGVTLDPSFQTGANIDDINWFKVLSDGSILHSKALGVWLVRRSPDGLLDPGFGLGGELDMPGFGELTGVLERQGHLLVHGRASLPGQGTFKVRALHPDGSVDTSALMNAGDVVYNGHDHDLFVKDVAVDQAGRFVGVGSGGGSWVIRLDSTGVPDTNFAGLGYRFPEPLEYGLVRPLPGGQLALLGQASAFNFSVPSLALFNDQGERLNPISIDFAGDPHNFQYVRDAVVGADLKVYAIVHCNPWNSSEHSYVTRLHFDGTVDTTFATGGVFDDPFFPLNTGGYCIGSFQNGDILMVQNVEDSLNLGMTFNKLQLRRLSSTGVPVTNWGMAGRIRTDLLGTGGLSVWPYQVHVLNDDRFLLLYRGVSSGQGEVLYLASFLPSGALDNFFGNGGIVPVAPYDNFAEMVVHPDGSILVGYSVWVQSERNVDLKRFLPDGSPDPGFGTGGVLQLGAPGGVDINSVDLALDGQERTIVSGEMALNGNWPGETDWFILRLPPVISTHGHGTGPADRSNPVQVFPNPAVDAVHVKLGFQQTSRLSSMLFDAHGRTLVEFPVTDIPPGEHVHDLDLPLTLANGVYWLGLSCDQWTRLVPLVVQR